MLARISGAWGTVSSAKVRVGSTWKPVRSVKAYIGGVWKEIVSFVPALTASASPTTLIGTTYAANATTDSSTTVTPAGGLGPYTYSWARISGAYGQINSATSATTTFTAYSLPAAATETATFRCTVTDAIGQTATADVTATFYQLSF